MVFQKKVLEKKERGWFVVGDLEMTLEEWLPAVRPRYGSWKTSDYEFYRSEEWGKTYFRFDLSWRGETNWAFRLYLQTEICSSKKNIKKMYKSGNVDYTACWGTGGLYEFAVNTNNVFVFFGAKVTDVEGEYVDPGEVIHYTTLGKFQPGWLDVTGFGSDEELVDYAFRAWAEECGGFDKIDRWWWE